jgi:hypothetical protein
MNKRIKKTHQNKKTPIWGYCGIFLCGIFAAVNYYCYFCGRYNVKIKSVG